MYLSFYFPCRVKKFDRNTSERIQIANREQMCSPVVTRTSLRDSDDALASTKWVPLFYISPLLFFFFIDFVHNKPFWQLSWGFNTNIGHDTTLGINHIKCVACVTKKVFSIQKKPAVATNDCYIHLLKYTL